MCLEHYYQVSPLHGWNRILRSPPGLTPEDLFEVTMGLNSPQRDLISESSRGVSPPTPTPKALAHCPGPPQEAQWLGALLDACWFPKTLEVWLPPIEPCFPFPPSVVYMNGHFLLGQGSINTSEIPFVLISPEASTETRWLQPAPFTPGTFPPGFDWTMPLFSLCP